MLNACFLNESLMNYVKKYQETYGKEIDFTIIPKGLTQEKLGKCIELMIDDNISLIVAYEKLYCK